MKRLAPLCLVFLSFACTIVVPPDPESTETATSRNTDSGCDCVTECEADGFYCTDPDTCTCGEPIDQMCSGGASNLCECLYLTHGYECTGDDWIGYYVTCYQWQDQPTASTVLCFGIYSPPDECQDAEVACVQ